MTAVGAVPDNAGVNRVSLASTIGALSLRILPAWGFVLLTFGFWKLDLRGSAALSAYWIAESGGPFGLPPILALAVALLVTRPGLSTRRRARELVTSVGLIVLLLGGVAWVNEHVIKPAFAVPRPNIEELADGGALGQSAEDFYDVGDKEARRGVLKRILHAHFDRIALAPAIRAHWIQETGYSFPSGHATAAFTTATLLMGLGLLALSGWRRWAMGLVLPWAVLVCWSRPVLRVHSPLDVSVGSAQGIVLGLVGVLIAWKLLWSGAGGVGPTGDSVDLRLDDRGPET